MSENAHDGQMPEQEKGKELMITKRVSLISDWLHSLQERVNSNQISADEMILIIARSMVAKELMAERARKKAKKDPLTKLLNKVTFDEEIKKLVDNGLPFGLLIIDIDHFKKVNDTYGHTAGDSVLIQTAQNLSSYLRQIRTDEMQNDQIFRYGGEEFAVLLHGINKENVLMGVAERIRNSIGNFPYSVRKEKEIVKIPITVSIGGGINRHEQATPFFDRVDQGLYEAKGAGRNRTVIVSILK